MLHSASIASSASGGAEGTVAAWPAGRMRYDLVKRAMDLALGAVLLALAVPVLLVAAAAIKLTSRGPILFKQVRGGLHGRPFTMCKLRTMHIGAEEDRQFLAQANEKAGPVFKISDDPRLTWVGRWLRRTSIDELPQLINVLVGQMSLVGPRPLWLPEARAVRGPAAMRAQVKPGLTCLWQISGRSELSYEHWVQLDLYYVRHRSILLDVLILVQTIPAVLSCRGAY